VQRASSYRVWYVFVCAVVVSGAFGAQGLDATTKTENNDIAFVAANNAAMTTMMKGMSVTPSGDVDRDFVAMMVPHHQGANDMARLELRYGHNERLRRLAQEIVVTQQAEIAAMRLAIDGAPPAKETDNDSIRKP